MRKTVLFIAGPTGIGKTALSLELARRMPCEIVSADSRQIYKYMDIGTAKPNDEELAAVPHHFIDIQRPDEVYSAGQFGRDARRCIDDILARGKQAIVAGGSGLYIRGLVDGFSGQRVADAGIKKRLKKEADEMGIALLYQRLQKVDPKAAEQLHATDTQRILRALEVFEISGKPWSELIKNKPEPAAFKPVMVALNMEREKLYGRIERRVDNMVSLGLVEEVRKLENMGYGPDLNALRSVGYQEVFQYFSGELEHAQMVALIKQKTRNYAKRQLTWFRKDQRYHWFDMEAFANVEALAEQILNIPN